MKIKLTRDSFTPKNVVSSIKRAGRGLWGILTRRFWLKLISLVLAILLWNYVVSSNTSITRNKTLTGMDAYITNQSTLSNYKLALLDDPSELLQGITVRVQVSQSEYAYVSSNNVQVMLDLSSVRTAGTQQVALKATTTYGRVLEIMPSTLTLTFDALDSRSVPVSAQIVGDLSDGMWYNVVRTNPSAITVSGAASVVQGITMARVDSDVTGAAASYTRAEHFVLLDGNGQEISQKMLSCSSSSISVSMDAYPCKELPISTAVEDVVTGQLPSGYEITTITIQPGSITVAAEAELLDALSEIKIEPIPVDGQTQNISVRADLSLLSDFIYVSAEQVYVNITITEITNEPAE